MEENPSTQSSRPPAGREVPRSRSPRADFSTPEESQPKPKPSERGMRRSGAKAAPPVTFQPPLGEGDAPAGEPRRPRKATPKPKPPAGTPAGTSTPAPASTPAPRPGKSAKAGAPAKPTPPAETQTPAEPAPTSDVPEQPAPTSDVPEQPAPTSDAAAQSASTADAAAQSASTADAATLPAAAAGAPAAAKAASGKASGRKTASRKAGMAARTQVTAAKAFPQQAAEPEQSMTRDAPGSDVPARAAKPDVANVAEAPPQEVTPAPARKATRRNARTSGSPAATTAEQSAPTQRTLPVAEQRVPHQASAKPDPAEQPRPEPTTVTTEPAGVPEPATTATPPAADPTRSEPTAGTPTAGGNEEADTPVAGTVATVRSAAVAADRAGATAERTAGQLRRIASDTWTRVAADPSHTAEVLALVAVQTIGPRAAEWARNVRESYPTASADGIAQLAVRQFTRRGGVSSALASVAGVYAPAALLGTAAYHHAELVLHVAAAYGEDPSDPARAADLLVLTRVHPSREDAEAALAAAQEPTAKAEGGTGPAWRLGRTLVAQAGIWAALRTVGRFFPGTAMVVAAVTSRAATETLGVRARTYYQNARSEPTAR